MGFLYDFKLQKLSWLYSVQCIDITVQIVYPRWYSVWSKKQLISQGWTMTPFLFRVSFCQQWAVPKPGHNWHRSQEVTTEFGHMFDNVKCVGDKAKTMIGVVDWIEEMYVNDCGLGKDGGPDVWCSSCFTFYSSYSVRGNSWWKRAGRVSRKLKISVEFFKNGSL